MLNQIICHDGTCYDTKKDHSLGYFLEKKGIVGKIEYDLLKDSLYG